MMKKILLLIAIVSGTLAFSQTTYYTCATGSDPSLTADPAGGGSCNVPPATWNAAGNTIVIRNGTSFGQNGQPTLDCDIIVENNGTIDLSGSVLLKGNILVENGGEINYNSALANTTVNLTGRLVVEGLFDFNGGANVDMKLVVLLGGYLEVTSTGSLVSKPSGANKGKIENKLGGRMLIAGTVDISDEFKGSNLEITEIATLNVGKFKTEGLGTATINGTVIVSNVAPYLQGKVEIKAPTTLNGSITCNVDFKLKGGNLIGHGTITNTGTWTQDDAETINGITNWGAVFTSPVNLSTVGFIWNGSNWTGTSPAGATGTFNDANDWGIILSDYTSSTDGDWTAGGASIPSTNTLTIDNNENLTSFVSVKNDGDLVLVNNVNLGEEFYLSGSGSVTARRTFRDALVNDWVRIGFPFKSFTWNDITTTNFLKSNSGGTANFYYWNASNSNWTLPANAPTDLATKSFAVFIFNGTSRSIEVTRPNADFNNEDQSFALDYDLGTGAGVPGFVSINVDGWNQMNNPFMSFVSSQDVVDALVASGDFNDAALSIWDGSQYKVWDVDGTSGDAEAEFLAPFQAFFARTLDALPANSAFSVTSAMRSATTTPTVTTFKNHPTSDLYLNFSVTGEGETVRTSVGRNPNATFGFDAGMDVSFQFPASDMPVFYSLDDLGNAMRGNKIPTIDNSTVYLGFDYPMNNKDFTIFIDSDNLPKRVKAYLKDLHTGKTKKISKKAYSFKSDATAPNPRFELTFRGKTKNYKSAGFDDEEVLDLVWFTEAGLNIMMYDILEEADVAVYNSAGQLVFSNHYETLFEEEIPIDGTGLFIIHISGPDDTSIVLKAMKL